jgi:hypothetical protein
VVQLGDQQLSLAEATGALSPRGPTFAATEDTPLTLDHETQPELRFTVSVGDGTLAVPASFVVDVLDVDEAPFLVPGAPTRFALGEHAAPGTVVGRIQARDPDAGDVVSFLRLPRELPFAINAATGEITVDGVLDRERLASHSFGVTFTDGVNAQTVSVTVDLNDEPEPMVGPRSMVEREGAAVMPFFAVTQFQDPFLGLPGSTTFSLAGGEGRFVIDAGTGVIRRTAVLDFEAGPVIPMTVTATKGTRTASQPFTVEVENVDEPMTITSLPTGVVTVREDLPTGILPEALRGAIGQFFLTDPDSDASTARFALRVDGVVIGGPFSLGPSPGSFTSREAPPLGEILSSNAAYISLATPLDFETRPEIRVELFQVRPSLDALDIQGRLIEANVILYPAFTLRVTDVPEAPVLTGPTRVEVGEISILGTPIADFGATDQDAGSVLRFSLADGFGRFAIDANTGVITLASPLDFETQAEWNLTVRVSDGALTDEAVLRVAVLDRPDPLPLAADLF